MFGFWTIFNFLEISDTRAVDINFVLPAALGIPHLLNSLAPFYIKGVFCFRFVRYSFIILFVLLG